MTVARLNLTDFRSYRDLTIEPGPGLNVLAGENGAGKTNLLEAVSLLSPGRGLRGATLGEVARVGGAGGFAVAARLADATEIGTGTQAAAPERRLVRINGAAASAAALGERAAVLWLTPAHDRVFVESAGGRRRFLDRLVLALDPGHASHATRYEAAMRARNRLLADARPDLAWLAALEAAMAAHGQALVAARERTVAALGARLATSPAGPFARAGLALEGWHDDGAGEAGLAAALSANRRRDAEAGRALAGPHRTDLAVTHLDKGQPAARASTGEQKALLLGIVLGHADLVADQVGRRPILLLDEVAAHLDPIRRAPHPPRRAALLARLAEAGGQVWLTGTERALFSDATGEARHWLVSGGAVRPD
jgi:DNA replication and repair protein RecF